VQPLDEQQPACQVPVANTRWVGCHTLTPLLPPAAAAAAAAAAGPYSFPLLVMVLVLLLLLLFLPAAVQRSIALPDVHSGYGFAIGNVAAFDMNNPEVCIGRGST
jgi:hypothetical protein